MGSRSGSSYKNLLLSGGSSIVSSREKNIVTREISKISDYLKDEQVVQAVGSITYVVARSDPAISTIYAAYRFSFRLYDIASRYERTYERYGEKQAKEQLVGDLATFALEKSLPYVTSAAVDTAYPVFKSELQKADVTFTRSQDELLKTVGREILKQGIRKVMSNED